LQSCEASQERKSGNFKSHWSENIVTDNGNEVKPRLGIVHFLVWMSLNAVLFALFRSQLSQPYERLPWLQVTLMIQVTQAATAIGGGPLLFVARRWRGYRYPVEPGEWILVAIGTDLLIRGGITKLLSLFVVSNGVDAFARLGVFLMLIPVCLWLLPAFLVSRASWKWYFGTMTLLHCGRGLLGFLAITDLPTDVAAYACAILATIAMMILLYSVITDWRREADRGWAHGVGVLTFLLYPVQMLIVALYGLFSENAIWSAAVR
jgi:hypothetical protein